MARRLKFAESRLASGELIFQPISWLPIFRPPDYGLAFVPDGWTKTHWSPYFNVVEVKTNFAQDVNVALRCN